MNKQQWQADQKRLAEVYAQHPEYGRDRLARAAKVHECTAQRFLKKVRNGKPVAPLPQPFGKSEKLTNPPPPENVSVEYAADKASITTTSPKITTLDEALAAAQVDLSKWEVSRHSVNWWDVTMKGEDGKPLTVRNFQIKIWLQPRQQSPIHEALKELTADLIGKGPQETYIPIIRTNDPHMLEISIFDLHFGKLAWAAETGTDYDIKIAEQLFRDAINRLLASTKTFHLDKILLPIGSDFLHVNGPNNATVNNTPQDVDTRMAKIYKTACRVVIEAINDCSKVAQVKVIFVPGNHDRDASFYLCSYLEAWYRQHEGVVVDVAPTARKYERYGTSLIGFTHGDEEKTNDLPLLMAGERQDFGAVSHREWHIGHLHKRKEMHFTVGDTHGPVVVRILPSLSGTDAWHYRRGYVNGNRAAEAYLWSFRHGYSGHFSANVN